MSSQVRFNFHVLLLSLSLVSASVNADPNPPVYGMWVFDGSGVSYRIIRTDNGYQTIADGESIAAETPIGRKITGVNPDGTLRGVFYTAHRGRVTVLSIPTRGKVTTDLNHFETPIHLEGYTFHDALVDEVGWVYLRGTNASKKPVLVYAKASHAKNLVWEVIDDVALKKIVAAPGGRGIVGLSEDGFALFFQGHGGALKPRLTVTEINSPLNLIQDIAAGPIGEKLQPALALITTTDPKFGKASQIFVIDESLTRAYESGRPIRLRDAHRVVAPADARGLLGNFDEMTSWTIGRTIAAAKNNPTLLRPFDIRELEAEISGFKDACPALLTLRPHTN